MSHADKLMAERARAAGAQNVCLFLYDTVEPGAASHRHPRMVWRVDVEACGSGDPAFVLNMDTDASEYVVTWRKVAAGECAGQVPPSPAGFKLYGLGRFGAELIGSADLPPMTFEGREYPRTLTAFVLTPGEAAHALNRLLVFGWAFETCPEHLKGCEERARDPRDGDDIRPVRASAVMAACGLPAPTGGADSDE